MKTRFLKIGFVGIIIILVIFIIGSNFSESKELDCLRLYKDVREISRTPEMQLAEPEPIKLQKLLILEYVEKNCPEFEDLAFMYKSYTGNDLPK